MEKYQVEKLIDEKIEENEKIKHNGPDCFTMIITYLFTVLILVFIILPFLCTTIGVYQELISRGLPNYRAFSNAIAWPIRLIPMISDTFYIVR